MKVTKVTETVKEKVLVEKEVTRTAGVTLELSLEEAVALRILVGSLGGPMEGTIRLLTDPLYDKMGDALGIGSFGPNRYVYATTEPYNAPQSRVAMNYIKETVKKIR